MLSLFRSLPLSLTVLNDLVFASAVCFTESTKACFLHGHVKLAHTAFLLVFLGMHIPNASSSINHKWGSKTRTLLKYIIHCFVDAQHTVN